ncbi:MAG: hypothetical protein R8K20_10260 [Gallionellaceae bacterium]
MLEKGEVIPHKRYGDLSPKIHELDKIGISVKSHKLLKQLLQENPKLDEIMRNSSNEVEALVGVEKWVSAILEKNPVAVKYFNEQHSGRETFESLNWSDHAAIRLLDYIKHAGREFEDLNLRGELAISNPVKMIWLATRHGSGGAKPYFFEDMLQLFRQLEGKAERKFPSRHKVEEWMERWPSGVDPRIVQLREENRERILNIIIGRIDKGEIKSGEYRFDSGLSHEAKFQKALEWWDDYAFHLSFAVRSPNMLNEMLGNSLDPDTMRLLYSAEKAGIPFFVNPYYLSLLHVRVPYFAIGADLAIRDYVIYSEKLIEEFGHIVAWEKEDLVQPGKPNAAGWLLPTQTNIHRRYPEVAILIPDTVGRACAGLCASCQRMYDFQRGNLNFNLEKLKPKESWPEKLKMLMAYFENDSQLRDILITGGDALMSSDKSLEIIFDAIYDMSLRKVEANKKRAEGEKYAEIVRVRLGTRLPVYSPQRITDKLTKILADFKAKASKIGIRQFVVQTHFISPMEVTPEAREGLKKLMSAGWTVTNQHVLVASSSQRGHTAKLRKVLNDIGVLPYYTFTVKGYMENQHSFATNSRAVQEQLEEKSIGLLPKKYYEELRDFPNNAETMVEKINALRNTADVPFLATDRNVINLPGVGKSLSFRTIGITRYGRRILEFDHDATRVHSPITKKMGKVVIIESKSISEYLQQLESVGEDVGEYESIWGYSLGETEPRMPLYEYPKYEFKVTDELTNLVIE